MCFTDSSPGFLPYVSVLPQHLYIPFTHIKYQPRRSDGGQVLNICFKVQYTYVCISMYHDGANLTVQKSLARSLLIEMFDLQDHPSTKSTS